jgi:hypothetical protein
MIGEYEFVANKSLTTNECLMECSSRFYDYAGITDA